ncbi:MAG: DUF7193 family protein [Shewanella sp.]
MEDWLAKHAGANLWQGPNLDQIVTVAPCRLTNKSGAVGFIRHGGRAVHLPDEGWWHVFVIDKLNTTMGNLNIPERSWKKVSACVNGFSAYFRLYNTKGQCHPLSKAWVLKQNAGQIYIAIPHTQRYDWVGSDELYLTIKPGFVNNIDYNETSPTSCEFFQTPSAASIQVAVDRYNYLTSLKKGLVEFWHNGSLAVNPKTSEIASWDDIEIFVDGRAKRVIDYACNDLPTFGSMIDTGRKYLIHLPKKMELGWAFRDDVEIFVLWQGAGRYYHKHRVQSLRQLTFNDLSIPVARIAEMRNNFNGTVTDIDQFTIRVIVRDSCIGRKPIFIHDRVHDLYRLDDAQIVDAMVGVNSLIPEWRAPALELSPANAVAGNRYSAINRDKCTLAYGYNAAARYSADTPQKLTQTARGWACELPALLAVRSTVYEYDEHGRLVSPAIPHQGDSIYTATNPLARYIEAIAGDVSDAMNIVDDAPDFKLNEGENVELWIRTRDTNQYRRAVLGTDYNYSASKITWTVERDRYAPTVVYDNVHIYFEQDVDITEGELRIPILGRSPTEGVRTLWTEMETVECWLNQSPLVFGIDYVVNWPEIVIVNKAWISDDRMNKVAVRARGVTGKLRSPKTGFISSGLLSNNNRFDVRDDKVIRIVGAGRLLTRDEVKFREDNMIGTNTDYDGFPYSVDDPTIPLRTIVTGNTYQLRDVARELDGRVEEYLTNWFPTPPPVEPVPLKHWYHLFSPLLNKLLWDYKEKRLLLVEDDPDYRVSTTQLDEIMERYKDMLLFDPAYIGHDKTFVKVHPHAQYSVMEIDELCYAFIDRVNQRFLRGSVQLNQYLKIKGNA